MRKARRVAMMLSGRGKSDGPPHGYWVYGRFAGKESNKASVVFAASASELQFSRVQRPASPARAALARAGVDAVVGRLRFLNFEITADLLGEKIVDFAMARYSRCFSSRSVYEDRVLATFSKQNAAVLLKVTKKVVAFHAAGSRIFSRITSFP